MNYVKFDGLMRKIAEDKGYDPSLIKGPKGIKIPRERVSIDTAYGTYMMDMRCYLVDHSVFNEGDLRMTHCCDREHNAMRQSLYVGRLGQDTVVGLEEVMHRTFLSVGKNGVYRIVPIKELTLEGVSGQIREMLSY